jgi:cysteine desulfurase
MAQQIYLDYAAATPLDPSVLAEMQPFFSEAFYNPPAKAVHQALQSARSEVASWLGAKAEEITFTAGCTEANNLAIHGIMARYPDANMVVSAIEHDSVLEPTNHYRYQVAGVSSDGSLDLAGLQALINDQTVLVSVMYANNEVGTIEPIKDIAHYLAAVRRERQAKHISLPLYLHTDAAQAGNYLDLHVARLGVDLMTLNGGKLYGPKQSGILYIRSGIELQPLIYGGGQERGLRGGTENVAAYVGLAKALSLVQTARHDEVIRLHGLQMLALELLHQALPQATVNGSIKHRLPNNLHLTIPGADNERLLVKLDEKGIYCAAGSACSARSSAPSHVLRAIGLSDADARGSLRVTMGRMTTDEDIRRFVQTISSLV